MFSVTLRKSNASKRKEYRTESGAFRAIRKWLLDNQDDLLASAMLYSPLSTPQEFTHADELPNVEKKRVDFYATQKWKTLRVSALLKYAKVCAICNKTEANNVSFEVDHIKPRSKFPELALDINNLRVICELCNRGKLDKTDEELKA